MRRPKLLTLLFYLRATISARPTSFRQSDRLTSCSVRPCKRGKCLEILRHDLARRIVADLPLLDIQLIRRKRDDDFRLVQNQRIEKDQRLAQMIVRAGAPQNARRGA